MYGILYTVNVGGKKSGDGSWESGDGSLKFENRRSGFGQLDFTTISKRQAVILKHSLNHLPGHQYVQYRQRVGSGYL
jgi:hypothetical protein